jgi:hypothetical protein
MQMFAPPSMDDTLVNTIANVCPHCLEYRKSLHFWGNKKFPALEISVATSPRTVRIQWVV